MPPFPEPVARDGEAPTHPHPHPTVHSAAQMDEDRARTVAYEYLCHLEEAKNWMSACIGEQLPPTTQMEEALRNGVYLAKLAHFFAPKVVGKK